MYACRLKESILIYASILLKRNNTDDVTDNVPFVARERRLSPHTSPEVATRYVVPQLPESEKFDAF